MERIFGKKWLAVGIILLFVGTCLVPANALDTDRPLPASRGNWLYVGGSGSGNYSRIQDAIDDASERDTVFVFDDSSPYYEHVTIDKSITLLGENRDTTIIDANKSGSPITLEANNVTVCGFTIQNSGEYCYEAAGIYIKNSGGAFDSNNNYIIGNNIIHNHHGFYGHTSKNNTITNNIIMNNAHGGIYFDACHFNIIQNNTIIGNTNGVMIYDSSFVKVNKNTIDDNYEFGVLIIGIFNYSTNNQITNNSITNHLSGLKIWGEHTTVKYNYIANNNHGIYIKTLGLSNHGKWNTIESNIIATNSKVGLYMDTAIWCNISKNNFIGNTMHASFTYELLPKMMSPFYGHFLQMNKYYRNYWDDHNITIPRVIHGKMLCFDWLSFLNGILNELTGIPIIVIPIYIPWICFDKNPVQEPYDIPVMS